MKNKAFTLIELLVVVLIIGVLAAIAVPQYQKAVLKSQLHTGMPIVESLYQAQQIYYLQHGEYATDIDELDLSIPIDESCTKEQSNSDDSYSRYICSFGTIGFANYSIQFKDPNNQLLYSHIFNGYSGKDYTLEAGKRYCYAKGTNATALDICKSFGGEQVNESETGWNRFKID